MRRIGVALIAVLITIAVAASASGTTGGGRVARCPPGHAHTVVADTQAQVYKAPEAGVEFPEGFEFFACAYGHRVYRLGPAPYAVDNTTGGIHHLVMAGLDVAYEESIVEPAYNPSYYFVIVRDLRDGRVREVPTGVPATGHNHETGPATDIVVSRAGDVAWIVSEGQARSSVRFLGANGTRTLVQGADIDPTSLALAGSTIYWTQGGKPFSATLN